MKKLSLLALALFSIIALAACGSKNQHYKANYDIVSFENAVGNGDDPTGKTVVFKVDKYTHHIILGSYTLSGDNFNFNSKGDPKVKKDDVVIVKVTSVSGDDISYNSLKKVDSLKEVTVTHKNIKPKKLILKISDGQTANINGDVTIIGKTLPNANIQIGMGIIGDSTKSDSSGDFTLKYKIPEDEKSVNIKIVASLNEKITNKTITVNQNQDVIKQYEAKLKTEAELAKTKAATAAAKDEKKKAAPAPTPTPISFADLMNKLSNFQLKAGETYSFSALIVADKPGGSYPEHGIDPLGNFYVLLRDPNNPNSDTDFQANPNKVLTEGVEKKNPSDFTIKIVMVNYPDGDAPEPDLVVTSINGTKVDTSDFKTK